MESWLDAYINEMLESGDEEGGNLHEEEKQDGNKAEKQTRTVLSLHKERLSRVVFDKGAGPDSIVLYMDGDSALREKNSAPCFNFNLVYDSLNDHQLWEIFMLLRKAGIKPDRSGYVVLNDLLFSDKLNGRDVAQLLKFIDFCRR